MKDQTGLALAVRDAREKAQQLATAIGRIDAVADDVAMGLDLRDAMDLAIKSSLRLGRVQRRLPAVERPGTVIMKREG